MFLPNTIIGASAVIQYRMSRFPWHMTNSEKVQAITRGLPGPSDLDRQESLYCIRKRALHQVGVWRQTGVSGINLRVVCIKATELT